MNSENASTRIDELFERLAELPTAEREACLARECTASPEIRAAVEARLRAFDRVAKDTEFLEPRPRISPTSFRRACTSAARIAGT